MVLSSAEFGPFKLFVIETGRFRLDGGAMFGVVPKTLWSRFIKPDEKNRIEMAMRCLLIQSENTGRTYLIDTGIGHKFTEKFEKIYAIDHDHSDLIPSLKYHGFNPEDITDIIFTHLHFDHCGGTTEYNEASDIQEIIFPNANLWLTKQHWETATNPNARETASFLDENIQPLKKSDHLNLIEGNYTFEDGLSTIIVNGHTLGQQLPVLEANGRTMVFVADLLPTTVHIPLPWVMGYDMYPVDTLKEKKEFLDRAADNSWYLYFEHDANTELAIIEREDNKYTIKNSGKLDMLNDD